ncbi:hypothetical protein V6N13_044987 [Hibiscus sabdariffa]
MENSSKTSTFCLVNILFHLLPCLFFFIQYLIVAVTGDVQVTPYDPIENITIDCGSSTNAHSLNLRPWTGDAKGRFTPVEQRHNKNKSSGSEVNGKDENHWVGCGGLLAALGSILKFSFSD